MKKKVAILMIVLAAPALAEKASMPDFSAGEVTPRIFGRTNTQKFYSGVRLLENMFVWPHGPVEKRPGTYYVSEVTTLITTPAVPGTPDTPGTYTLMSVSENGSIFQIPLFDQVIQSLNVGDTAKNIGGGVVGLPMSGHPFLVGQTVLITNTIAYDGTKTVQSGTTTSEVRINATYIPETFTGSEILVGVIPSLPASAGRMDSDSSNNIFYGHNYSSSTWITKIEPNGVEHTDSVVFSTLPPVPSVAACMGLKLSADYGDLYTLVSGIYKFDLSDGSETWFVGSVGSFDLDVDSSDRTYVSVSAGLDNNVNQFASADGAETVLTLMGEFAAGATAQFSTVYDVHVDDALGLVMQGGIQRGLVAGDETTLYNFSVRTFNDASGDQAQPGGTFIQSGVVDTTYIIGVGMITSNGSNIYVLSYTPTPTLYKYSWDGTSLSQVASAAAPSHASGIFFDIYGNLICINNNGTDVDVVWFFDTDLTFLTKIDNMSATMLDTWLAAVGSTWQSGNAVFNGGITTPGVPSVPGTTRAINTSGDEAPARLFSFAAVVGDGRIIEAGDQYFTFYKDVP